jgi:hypothetical protein
VQRVLTRPMSSRRSRIPMRNGEEELGYLVLGPRSDGAAYGDPDVRTLQSSADLVGRAIALSKGRLIVSR